MIGLFVVMTTLAVSLRLVGFGSNAMRFPIQMHAKYDRAHASRSRRGDNGKQTECGDEMLHNDSIDDASEANVAPFFKIIRYFAGIKPVIANDLQEASQPRSSPHRSLPSHSYAIPASLRHSSKNFALYDFSIPVGAKLAKVNLL